MKYTNGDIKRLGETIVKNNGIINDDELELLQNYRKSFTEPLSLTFNKLVAIKNNVGRDGIIAFRLKRIRTIVNKVLRNPSMQLNRMGDIAGIRIILENQNQVYKALKLIEAEFEISGKIRDYIANPKRIGYKGVHVYIKDKNFNKRIEVQIRTRDYHNWSTLVEITDLLYGTRLKELGYENNPEFGEFHSLMSSDIELTRDQANLVYELLRKTNFITKLSQTFRRNNEKVKEQWHAVLPRSKYFLIESSTSEIPSLKGFTDYDRAEEAYFKTYKEDPEALIVLTAIQKPTFDQISVAYANYILSYHTFIKDIEPIIKTLAIEAIEQGRVQRFKRIFKTYEELEANGMVHIVTGKGNLIVSKAKNRLLLSSIKKISSRKQKLITKEIRAELRLRIEKHREFMSNIRPLIEGKGLKSWICRSFLKRNGKRIKQRLKVLEIEFSDNEQ
jgi:DNA-binding transcriptional regulator YhcF (GntR family)